MFLLFPLFFSRYKCVSVLLFQVDVGVMTREEADACISVEFNPVRARFAGSEDVWTRDVLNLGVSPGAVIAQVGNKRLGL